MVGIVPRTEAPGVDICCVDDYFYIVRSDLNSYMRSANLNKDSDLKVFSLHPSCRGGDHYMGSATGHFRIIKGNTCRRVLDLHTDSDALVYALHPNCRGGDHYLSVSEHVFIVFQSRGVYRVTKDLQNDQEGKEHKMHPECLNGLYYFGSKKRFYIVKSTDKSGVQYHRCDSFTSNDGAKAYSFHPNVLSFLPGGLAMTRGSSRAAWVCIKTIANDSETPVTRMKRINKKTGYEKEKMASLEKCWNVSEEVGGLTALLAMTQLSLDTEYGGYAANTNQEDWSEATETEEVVSATLQPKQKMYIWQYQMFLGKEVILFCRDITMTNDSTPPTENPLPPTA